MISACLTAAFAHAAWAPSDSQGPTARDMLARMDQITRSFEAADRRIPRDTFDPAAVAGQVSADPVKLFTWVRDNTEWVPYRGALRGPGGVLMDRAGNSLDRSLLLVELLRQAGFKACLAHGTLPQRTVQDALAQLIARDAKWKRNPNAGSMGIPAATTPAAEEAEVSLENEAEDLTQRVAEQVPVISSALGNAAPDPTASMKAAAAAALADHWWVQWLDHGTWADLDPLLPDAQPRRAMTVATQTVSPGSESKLGLDGALCHAVRLRVIVERWNAGRLSESAALDATLRPCEVLGQRIVLTNFPPNWPSDLDKGNAAQATARLKAAVLAQKEWVPILTIGSQQIIQSGVTDHGELDPKPRLDPIAKLGGMVGGFGGGFGGALGGSGRQPEGQGLFTAEWIEYQIQSPGEPLRTIRRQVFDLIGPAARAAGAAAKPAPSEQARVNAGLSLIGQVDILPLACQLSPQFVGHTLLADFVANRDGFAGLLQQAGATSGSAASKSASYRPLPAALYSMALLRRQWSRWRDEIYFDRPEILSYHSGLQLGADEQVRVLEAFDIVANDVSVRPRSWGNARKVRIAQGVVDTNVETLFVDDTGNRQNAAELLAWSPGQTWVMLRGADDPRWNSLRLPDDARARIRRDLAAGEIVLAPPAPIGRAQGIGWWAIDPRTGQTLGKGPMGWGGEVEYMTLVDRVTLFVARNKGWICFSSLSATGIKIAATVLGFPEVAAIAADLHHVLWVVCGNSATPP